MFNNGPRIITSGLVLSLDAADKNSYPGSGTTWTDLSGNNSNGTLSGSVLPTYNTANNGSIAFSGGANSTTYISEYSIPDSFWNAASWTVSAWVKFNVVNTGGTNDNAIIGHGSSGGQNLLLHLGERTAKVQFGMYSNDLTGTIPLSANTFYNIIWAYNRGSGLKQIYLNSILDTSAIGTTYAGTGTNTRIGSYSAGFFGLCLNGNLYNIQLYNRVLSATEVAQNYNSLKSRFNLI
jgi:hypothetical protein